MNEEKMLNVKQAAERLGVSPSMVYKLVSVGQICHTRVGRAIRIPATKIDQLLRSADYPTIHIDLPLPDAAAGQNSRCHWTKRAAATASLRMAAKLLWIKACGEAKVPHGWGLQRVIIDMHYTYNASSIGYKARDTANAIGAIKGAIDGLIDGGMAPDDSLEWVSWGNLVVDPKNPKSGVRLTIRPKPRGAAS